MRTVRSTVVASILLRARARVVPDTPLPKIGKETLLFAFWSHIFPKVVALAYGVTGSINTEFHAIISSHAGKVVS